ncbi:MAG: primosomal protein N' [Bacteroidota bacterium]|nr:primosomal protein N' [Bacteroidota bacterium]
MSALTFNSSETVERVTLFADIILPVPIPKLFTYRIPYELNGLVKPGCRVIVQFGNKKILTGLIGKLHEIAPTQYEARYILELLDENPIVSPQQLPLFRWIADYYMCTIGEVFNTAIPSGLKLNSETRIQINPSFNPTTKFHELSEPEKIIVDLLEGDNTINYSDISGILGITNINKVIKSLLQKQAILLFEEIRERYKPKIEKRVRLGVKYIEDKKELEDLFKQLNKSPKQENILLKYLQSIPVFHSPEKNGEGLSKKVFQDEGLSTFALNTLIRKQIFEEFDLNISRISTPLHVVPIPELSDAQEQSYKEIMEHFQKNDTVLLHGITGSGKTNIYLKLIQNVLDQGNQVLYLLPEIALTTQIVNRLAQIFGKRMSVYHSKFSANERVEVWNGVLNGAFDLIIGVRSSVLLPFKDLGLIIVDEEHEISYKQFDPAPRYHARDLALVLARHHHAKTLLGSATPSIESYYHAQTGKFGLVELHKRFGEAQLPEFIIADLTDQRKKKLMKGEISSVLLEKMAENLSKKEQAIIFQNRRGYAPYLTCEECAWIPKCINCAVSLTYHQYNNELRCHYCGHKEKIPSSCPACGASKIKTVGFGTEKLEEDFKILLPGAKVQRMDYDTTRKKYGYQTIIDEFEKGNIDILVGTQMVSKGLDFDKVSLVGIFDVDRLIHFPDFRSYERSFQLITQVSGRAGRREKTGVVVIQTANPKQEVLYRIINNDYKNLYIKEIAERQRFHYPPFVRLIKITLKHERKEIADKAALALKDLFKDSLSQYIILGPHEPLISRIRNNYLVDLLVKIQRNKGNLSWVKIVLQETSQLILQSKEFKNTRIIFDVDPY